MSDGCDSLEIAIVGSGSGAFAAALRAAEEGAHVTMIERGTLGGTCVNVGCVPSKILLRTAHLAHHQGHHPFEGLSRFDSRVDRAAMVSQQEARVESLRRTKYENLLAETPSIRLVRGSARFADASTLRVTPENGSELYLSPDRILLATGASPAIPDIPGLSESPYWTSTEALVAEEVPEHLIVVGGGFVALELGQAFRRLGAEVTLLARSTLLSSEEALLGDGLADVLREEGVEVMLHTVPESVHYEGGRFRVGLPGGAITGDRLLVATGRRPNTAELRLDLAGVETDTRGAIVVDPSLRTSASGIWAVGDCTDLPQLVYVAAAAGTRAAVDMTGGDATLDLSAMPAVVFTDPQAAWVGLAEDEAREEGRTVEVKTLPLDQVPRALVNFDTRGFVKLVADAESGQLLGVQILADGAGEVVQTAAVALAAGLTVEDLGSRLFPYLTMVEGLKLAAQMFTKDISRLSCCAG